MANVILILNREFGELRTGECHKIWHWPKACLERSRFDYKQQSRMEI